MSFTEPEFDWEGSTVIREQPRTAVYLNPHDEVVIRQSRWWDDEDMFVYITRANLPTLIQALQDLAMGL